MEKNDIANIIIVIIIAVALLGGSVTSAHRVNKSSLDLEYIKGFSTALYLCKNL